VQDLFDFVMALPLLLLAVDPGQFIAHGAGGAATVLGFLTFQVQDVLARTDPKGVPHHVYHGVSVHGRLLDAIDGIKDDRSLETERLPMEWLQVALPRAVAPARVGIDSEHRVPAPSVRTEVLLFTPQPAWLEVAASPRFGQEHFPAIDQL